MSEMYILGVVLPTAIFLAIIVVISSLWIWED